MIKTFSDFKYEIIFGRDFYVSIDIENINLKIDLECDKIFIDSSKGLDFEIETSFWQDEVITEICIRKEYERNFYEITYSRNIYTGIASIGLLDSEQLGEGSDYKNLSQFKKIYNENPRERLTCGKFCNKYKDCLKDLLIKEMIEKRNNCEIYKRKKG